MAYEIIKIKSRKNSRFVINNETSKIEIIPFDDAVVSKEPPENCNYIDIYLIDSKATIEVGDTYLYLIDGNIDPEIMVCQDEEEAERCNTHHVISHISHKVVDNNPLTFDNINLGIFKFIIDKYNENKIFPKVVGVGFIEHGKINIVFDKSDEKVIYTLNDLDLAIDLARKDLLQSKETIITIIDNTKN